MSRRPEPVESCPCCRGEGELELCSLRGVCSSPAEICPGRHRHEECEACAGSGVGLRCADCDELRGSAEIEIHGERLTCGCAVSVAA